MKLYMELRVLSEIFFKGLGRGTSNLPWKHPWKGTRRVVRVQFGWLSLFTRKFFNFIVFLEKYSRHPPTPLLPIYLLKNISLRRSDKKTIDWKKKKKIHKIKIPFHSVSINLPEKNLFPQLISLRYFSVDLLK